tara:strand:- start:131 stop:526 length:396 start_codon:yes stop_codon:yes gene_type:complete
VLYKKNLKTITDKRGSLMVLDRNNFNLLKINRIFVINFKKINTIRGNHAHKKTTQFLVCVAGKVEVTITNYKRKKFSYKLNNMKSGLLIKPYNWVKIRAIESKSSLMCIADMKFDKKEYINKFENFIEGKI